MHYLLVLVLITADGTKETTIEQPTLHDCWKRAYAVVADVDHMQMGDAGIVGYGAGCLVISDPTRDAGR